jgi:hypothetical protein
MPRISGKYGTQTPTWGVPDEAKEVYSASNNPVRPNHYKLGGLEVFDAIEAWGLQDNAYRFSAIRYLVRAGRKDPSKTTEDLRKTIVYIEREIRLVETNEKVVKEIEAEQIAEVEQSDSMRSEYSEQVQNWLKAFAGKQFGVLAGWLRHAAVTRKPERRLHLFGPCAVTGSSLLRAALMPLGEDVVGSVFGSTMPVPVEDRYDRSEVLYICTGELSRRFFVENAWIADRWLRNETILKHIYYLCGVR